MRKYLMIFISVLAFSCNENASSFTDTERDKTLSYLEQTMDQEGIPGLQIAVIKGNEVLLSESLGLANVPFKVDVQAHTIFPICSISKIFAATAILQLEEQNKLVLSDAISEYLPNLPEQWRSVRIEQLLSHTSGLPDIEDPNEDQLIGGKSEDAAWTAVQKMPIQFEPGEDFSYNATNFLLIQQLIEQLGEATYEEFVKSNQFDVAKMEQIFFSNSYNVKEHKGPTYIYYYKDEITGEYIKGNDLMETHETFPTILRADAGAFTTADEMVKWIMALQSGKLLRKESIAKMWTPMQLNDGKHGGFGGDLNAYALGWPVMQRERHQALVPTGGGRASIAVYPEDDLAVVLFTNLTGILTHEMVDKIAMFYFEE